MAKLEEKVLDHLCKALKASESKTQAECMIGYVKDMLLKVRQSRIKCAKFPHYPKYRQLIILIYFHCLDEGKVAPSQLQQYRGRN